MLHDHTSFFLIKETLFSLVNSNWYVLMFPIPVNLAIICYEVYYLGWHNSSLKRLVVNPSRSAKLDLILSLLYVTKISFVLALIFSFGLSLAIPVTIKSYFGYNLIRLIDNKILQFIISFLIIDFMTYVLHRASHHFKCLWEIHKLHHSATEFNIITAQRSHPFYWALVEIFNCLPFAIAGISIEVVVFTQILRTFLHPLQHTTFHWNWGSIGEFLLVSPIAHRIHHSPFQEHTNKNFGLITPIWDHIFGTWYNGVKINNSISTINNTYNQKEWYMEIWEAYVRFLKHLVPAIRISRL